MKLYYAPGACSLADHIALHEAGFDFDHEQVDTKAKKTESGADFLHINPKGYVPVLILDSGETVTENLAILDWITQQAPQLAPPGGMGRTHLLEMLGYLATEVHKALPSFSRVPARKTSARPPSSWSDGLPGSPPSSRAITCSAVTSAWPTVISS